MTTQSNDDGSSITYANIREFLDREWPTIRAVGAIVALATFIVSLRSLSISAERLGLEIANASLEGTATYSSLPREGLQEIADEMMEDLFAQVLQRSTQQPDAGYVDMMRNALPISRRIPASPIEIVTRIQNTGSRAARNASVSFAWIGAIGSVDVQALSPWTIAHGGVGESAITIEIERISQGETVVIRVAYEATQEDEDVMELGTREGLAGVSAFYTYPFSADESLTFPSFAISPSESTPSFDDLTVRVASDETAVKEIEPSSAGSLLNMLKSEFIEETRE